MWPTAAATAAAAVHSLMFCFLFDFHFVLSISAYYFATTHSTAGGCQRYQARVRLEIFESEGNANEGPHKMILSIGMRVYLTLFLSFLPTFT